jgi:hypothetical protein
LREKQLIRANDGRGRDWFLDRCSYLFWHWLRDWHLLGLWSRHRLGFGLRCRLRLGLRRWCLLGLRDRYLLGLLYRFRRWCRLLDRLGRLCGYLDWRFHLRRLHRLNGLFHWHGCHIRCLYRDWLC